jgi:putative MFS transporter
MQSHAILTGIDRLPRSRYLLGLVARVASGSLFEVLAAFFVGMFLITFVFGVVSDRFGHRAVFIFSMVIYSVAQFSIAIPSSAPLINLVRFVSGFAVGMQLVNNDSYVAELITKSR